MSFSLFLMLFTLWNCSQVNEKELNTRQAPELLPREKVLAMIELSDNGYEFTGPQRIKKEVTDEKFRERLINLVPLEDMFDGLEQRKKELLANKKEMAINVAQLPLDVDMRDYAGSIKEQWNGTCSAFGLIATEEVAQCKMRGDCGLDLSERHFWSFYKKYSAPTALKMSTNFVADEKHWPQDQTSKPSDVEKYADYRVSEYEYLGGDSQEAKNKVLSALANGRPVYMWSQTPSCLLSCKATCNATSNAFESGGHAYSIVGYFNRDNPVLIVKNSWGTDCGDGGYQYMSFKIWDNSTYWEAASLINVESKNIPTDPTIPDSPKYVTKCEYRWSWTHFWTRKKYCWEEEV